MPETHIPAPYAWEPYFLTATAVRERLNGTQISCCRFMRWQVCDSREFRTHMSDKNNVGLNSVISFGTFSGGDLWIEGLGDSPPSEECIAQPDHRELRGGYLGKTKCWVSFSPKRRHCTSQVTHGTRYSIVLFTPGNGSPTQNVTPAHPHIHHALVTPSPAPEAPFSAMAIVEPMVWMVQR